MNKNLHGYGYFARKALISPKTAIHGAIPRFIFYPGIKHLGKRFIANVSWR